MADRTEPIRITLTLPSGPDHIRLARLVASGLVAQLDFGLDDVEDLRIAVDELCSLVVEHARPASNLTVAYEVVNHEITVRAAAPVATATATATGGGGAQAFGGDPDGAGAADEEVLAADELSRLILMAAADEHTFARADGEVVGWMRKRPASATV